MRRLERIILVSSQKTRHFGAWHRDGALSSPDGAATVRHVRLTLE